MKKVYNKNRFSVQKVCYLTGTCIIVTVLLTILVISQHAPNCTVWLYASIAKSDNWQQFVVQCIVLVLIPLFKRKSKENQFAAVYDDSCQPKLEKRTVMFLDMKSSTRIAEQIGAEEYFFFLRDFFETLTSSILKHQGEIYQYVGDEVVITWPTQGQVVNHAPIACFKAMKHALKKRSSYFCETYGELPDFKASIHCGDVIVGKIGSIKKERVYTGDVLNTTARIIDRCKHLKSDLLISGSYYQSLVLRKKDFKWVTTEVLRGKSHATAIFSYQSIPALRPVLIV